MGRGAGQKVSGPEATDEPVGPCFPTAGAPEPILIVRIARPATDRDGAGEPGPEKDRAGGRAVSASRLIGGASPSSSRGHSSTDPTSFDAPNAGARPHDGTAPRDSIRLDCQ